MVIEIDGRKYELTENEAHVEAAVAWLKVTGGPSSALVVGELERRGAEIERLTARLQTAEKAAHEWRERAEGSDPIERDVARVAFRSWLGGDPYRLEFAREDVPVFESLFDVDRACKSFDVALTLAEHGEIGEEATEDAEEAGA